jgi:hypothetical protein
VAMIELTSISDLPNVPAVYAMFGGQGRSRYVAYVGLGSKLRGRIEQHLIRRDSSVTTGVSAVSLNPDFVTEVRWWEHPDFAKQDVLEASELVAFDVLEPALRSRGGITDRAKQLYKEAAFREKMTAVFSGEASGCLRIRSLSQAWDQIDELAERIRQIEDRLADQGGG